MAGSPAATPVTGSIAAPTGFFQLERSSRSFWQAFVEAIGVPEVAAEGFAEDAEGERTVAVVQAVLLGRTRAQWQEALTGLEVCVEPVLDIAETFEHPQVRSRGMRLDTGPGRPTAQTGFPIRLMGSPATFRRGAPGYGEHTDEVLAAAGYQTDEVVALRAAGVVR